MNWLIAALLVLLVAARAPTVAGSQLLRVHAPVRDSIVSGGGLVHVIVETEPGLAPSAVRVRLQGTDIGPGAHRARSRGGGVLHWTARLGPGPNTLEIEATPPGAPAVRETRTLYYFAPVFSATDPPKGLQRVPFHQKDPDAVCSECHVTRPTSQDAAPPTPDRSTCYSCHAELTRVKEVHGPAANWACTRCHDPGASPHRYATPEPVMPLCFGCHQEQKELFYGSPYQHGPTATGFCTICHNPHGTENGFFLKKAAWSLCTTCHFEKATGRHVVEWGPGGGGHPTQGRPDPKRPTRELACPSCHNPHAAPAPRLWNFGATQWLDLCRNCHGDKLGG